MKMKKTNVFYGFVLVLCALFCDVIVTVRAGWCTVCILLSTVFAMLQCLSHAEVFRLWQCSACVVMYMMAPRRRSDVSFVLTAALPTIAIHWLAVCALHFYDEKKKSFWCTYGQLAIIIRKPSLEVAPTIYRREVDKQMWRQTDQ